MSGRWEWELARNEDDEGGRRLKGGWLRCAVSTRDANDEISDGCEGKDMQEECLEIEQPIEVYSP